MFPLILTAVLVIALLWVVGRYYFKRPIALIGDTLVTLLRSLIG
jgi:hypothetical protein